MKLVACLLLLSVNLGVVLSEDISNETDAGSQLTCVKGLTEFDPRIHKQTYRVGVHAFYGLEATFSRFLRLFEDYLSIVVGQRFEPPIDFQLVATASWDLFEGAESKDLDFFYANAGLFSCIGIEIGAQPLSTAIVRHSARGLTFDLGISAGVIFASADRYDIETVDDLKDKIIGAESMSTPFGSQAQFYEMVKADMSWVMDPRQVVFTFNSMDIIQGVLSGEFDVGFVEEGSLERAVDENGALVDPDRYKIISNRGNYIMEDGNAFPLYFSTEIYPEYAFAALPHVPKSVSKEVQLALLAFDEHRRTGEKFQECLNDFDDEETCDSLPFPEAFDPNARCDTTKGLAQLAYEASIQANVVGFRPSPSYFDVLSMQHAIRGLTFNEGGKWECSKPSTLYEGITQSCPSGFRKVNRDSFEQGCEQIGLTCGEAYDCFCKPCEEEGVAVEASEDANTSAPTLLRRYSL